MECDICMDVMGPGERRPKVLPCGHTFCLRCLNCQESNVCAVDRKTFPGPASSLPDNFSVLRLSERLAAPTHRVWCRECKKDAAEVCLDAHQVCSLKKMRSDEARSRFEALQLDEDSLLELKHVIEESSRSCSEGAKKCVDRLEQELESVREGRRRLQAAVESDDADVWQRGMEVTSQSPLGESARHLSAALSERANCKVEICHVPGQGRETVTWHGSTQAADEPLMRVLLGRLLCSRKLVRVVNEGNAEDAGAAALPCVGRWIERSNEMTYEEMSRLIWEGSRQTVIRGKDWDPQCWADCESKFMSEFPKPGTVIRRHGGGCLNVRWVTNVSSYHRMEPGNYQLKLKPKVSLSSMKNPLKAVTFLNCPSTGAATAGGSTSGFGMHWTEMLDPDLDDADITDPSREMLLEVLRMGDRLREVCIRFTRSTADLLQEALRVPALRYLEVHCPFDAPLECPRFLGKSSGLRWLRAGVYPLLTALALIRQNAATLEELQLVAASTDPYGCPDLGEALRGCELRQLRRLTLLRAAVDDTPCRHDELTCREQRLQLLFALKGVSACEVGCNECGTSTFGELLRSVFSAAAREGNRTS